jgi:23S rRNA (cytidine1920-2'-O)/16S rRNA (cytidine1409-2'-O)-methyltransferase
MAVRMARERIDRVLVARGLAPTRARAQALIARGLVEVEGRTLDKPSDRVLPDAHIQLRSALRYVSRGGDKLAGALADLGLNVAGRVVADIGASTGGFTDCVLQAGAARVYAIDVGHDQLHPRLRADPRVVTHDGVNARELSAASLPEPVDLVLVDASFISLTKLLPALRALLRANGQLLCLVKPQFEVGPAQVGKRGVVRDDALRQRAVDDVVQAAAALGLPKRAQCACQLAGPEGNREIFVLLGPGQPASSAR